MSTVKKTRLFHKIIDLAKTNGGRVEVNDPKLAEILSKGGKVHANTMYRLPTQISGIRRVEKLEVVAIRTGKTVIAYEFPALQALATPVASAPSVQEPVAVGV